MGEQDDRHHGPHDHHTNTHSGPALVVYVHAIGCKEQPLLKQSIARRDGLHLMIDDFSIEESGLVSSTNEKKTVLN